MCEPGQYCKSDGTCAPVAHCSTSNLCSSGYTCQNGVCLENCTMNDSLQCTDGNAICAAAAVGFIRSNLINGPLDADSLHLTNDGVCMYNLDSVTPARRLGFTGSLVCGADGDCPTSYTCNTSTFHCEDPNYNTPQFSWKPIDLTNTTTTSCVNTSGGESLPISCLKHGADTTNWTPNIAGGGHHVQFQLQIQIKIFYIPLRLYSYLMIIAVHVVLKVCQFPVHISILRVLLY